MTADRYDEARLLASARRRSLLGLAIGSMTTMGRAADERYPARPVRLIVPFPPGGPVDLTARAIAQRVGEQWGQQIVVDNRPGAGGVIGAELAARARPDGYTYLMCSIHHAVLPALRPGALSYHIERDFSPVSFGAQFPIILCVHPSLAVHSVTDLLRLARSQPGKLAYASAGNGGGTHLAGELFAALGGVDLVHVPYKGSAPAMADLVGGQVQMMFADAPTALLALQAGRVRPLAVGSARRSAIVPDLPTIAESGLKGYEAYSWAGVVAPTATPEVAITRFSHEIASALNDPGVRARLLQNGADPMPSSPEQFALTLRGEIAKWGKIVRDAHIQPD